MTLSLVVCALLLASPQQEVRGELIPLDVALPFELSPTFFTSVADPFLIKTGGGLRVAWRPVKGLSFAARGAGMVSSSTGERGPLIEGTRVFRSVPLALAMGEVEWSPLVGKLGPLRLEGTLLVGGGTVIAESMIARPAFEAGVAMRVQVEARVRVSFELIHLSYVDTPVGVTLSRLEHLFSAGFAVTVPLQFR